MKQYLSYIILILSLISAPAFALDVVYPKKNNPVISAKSTFFIGNIGDDKEFFINNNRVQTYKNGVFVVVVPLEYGENKFTLKSISKTGKVTLSNYLIIKPKPVKITSAQNVPLVEFSDFISAEVKKDNIPLRETYLDSSNRVTHLSKGTKLYLSAKRGKNYQVYLNKNKKYWINPNYFTEITRVSEPETFCLNSFKYSYDEKYEYFIFNTCKSIPFLLKEMPGGVDVTFYYVSQIPKDLDMYAQNIRYEDKTLSFFIPHRKLWGYDCYFDGENMVFKLTRALKTDAHSPLKNIVVAIDAGHGGYESGAIGPTRVREAEITLDIAKKLQRLLIAEGAKPIMTRTKNENVDLYKRVDIIKNSNALFSISIHANALPDGANPYERYGTSVYYYYPQAKEFANTLKENMVEFLSTRDDGTRHGSFVLTRMTSPLSVLIETAYMINPFDYEKLNDNNFRQEIAKSIVMGLKAYLNSVEPK